MQLRNRFSEISGLLFETENTPTHFFFSSASPSIHFLSLLENYFPSKTACVCHLEALQASFPGC